MQTPHGGSQFVFYLGQTTTFIIATIIIIFTRIMQETFDSIVSLWKSTGPILRPATLCQCNTNYNYNNYKNTFGHFFYYFFSVLLLCLSRLQYPNFEEWNGTECWIDDFIGNECYYEWNESRKYKYRYKCILTTNNTVVISEDMLRYGIVPFRIAWTGRIILRTTAKQQPSKMNSNKLLLLFERLLGGIRRTNNGCLRMMIRLESLEIQSGWKWNRRTIQKTLWNCMDSHGRY